MSPRKPINRENKSLFASNLDFLVRFSNFTELSNVSGVGKATISDYRKGSEPRYSAIIKICEATKCPADWLLTGRSIDCFRLGFVVLPVLNSHLTDLNEIAYCAARHFLSSYCAKYAIGEEDETLKLLYPDIISLLIKNIQNPEWDVTQSGEVNFDLLIERAHRPVKPKINKDGKLRVGRFTYKHGKEYCKEILSYLDYSSLKMSLLLQTSNEIKTISDKLK